MNVDALGYRKKFGVLAPSTNTIVEPEFHQMAVPGVTAHMSRIHIHDQDISSDAKMEGLLLQIREEILRAIDRVKTAEVDYLVMGMSAETFWDGLKGNQSFLTRLETYSGLKVASGARACMRAAECLGLRKIGVLTPYQPIGDIHVGKFFHDIGIEVIALHGLRCPTAVSIAEVSEATLRQTLQELASHKIDGIVQVGTNLCMARLADEAERWLGLPVVAINAATWWHALRENGIQNQLHGFGSLLREY